MQYEKGRKPIIQGLIPGLTERGKIKIGMKGAKRTSRSGNEFRLPQKIDHFLVTTLERDENDNFKKDVVIHKELGAKPKILPIRLLFDDIPLNFQCRYTCYIGKSLGCSGDGEFAIRISNGNNGKETQKQVDCPCERKEPGYEGKYSCKVNGTLSVLVDCKSASIGGVWKFRTTGYNSTVGILSSLTLIHSITGGLLAGIPLKMVVGPKTTTADNKPVTIYVVGVEFKGSEESELPLIDQLRQVSLDMAQNTANHRLRMENVEETARKMIAYNHDLQNEKADIVDEFFPENNVEDVQDPEIPKDPEEPEPKVEEEKPKRKRKKKKEPVQEPEPERLEPIGDDFGLTETTEQEEDNTIDDDEYGF